MVKAVLSAFIILCLQLLLSAAVAAAFARSLHPRQPSSLPSMARVAAASGPSFMTNSIRKATRTSLNLVPFSEAWQSDGGGRDRTFSSLLPKLGRASFDSEGVLTRSIQSAEGDQGAATDVRYRLYLATDDDDLPPITKLTLDVFDATAITLSSTADWSALERAMVGAVVEPVVGAYNAYASAVAYTEVLSGLRRRMRNRMDGSSRGGGRDDWLAPLVVPEGEGSDGTEAVSTSEDVAARSSLILVLARPAASASSGEGEIEVAASVELRLQPTDAKIPFSQPWLDKIERKLARLLPLSKEYDAAMNNSRGEVPKEKGSNPPLRPYLCNLAVSPELRSLGVGRALCRIVEGIAREKWGYKHLYLHVDPSNDAARGLYEKEGYVDVGRRWNVFWAGGASNISYYVKRLEKD